MKLLMTSSLKAEPFLVFESHNFVDTRGIYFLRYQEQIPYLFFFSFGVGGSDSVVRDTFSDLIMVVDRGS